MSVVNCKVKYIRPKHNNLKEWIEDDNNVYIGRSGIVFIDKQRYPKVSSEFCNPFKIKKEMTRSDVIEKYTDYIEDKLKASPEMVQRLLELKDKNLGCWCAPEACHGDVLLKLINKYSV